MHIYLETATDFTHLMLPIIILQHRYISLPSFLSGSLQILLPIIQFILTNKCHIDLSIPNKLKLFYQASSLSSTPPSYLLPDFPLCFFGFFAFTITSSITRGFIFVKSIEFIVLFPPKGVMHGITTKYSQLFR